MDFPASHEQLEHARAVMQTLREAILQNATIKLPQYDPSCSIPGAFASQTVGIEPNSFGGTLGEFRYQFEGEEDLLHLIVTRTNLQALTPEEGLGVCSTLMPEVPAALIWFRPGELSQHFFIGHDELVR